MEKKAYIKMEILNAIDAMNQATEKKANLVKAIGAAKSGFRGLKAGLKGTRVSTRASQAAQKGQAVGKHLRKNKNVYAAAAGGTAAGAGGMAVANKMNEPDTIRERLAAAYQALRG